jgi:hypothetical protein
VSADYDLLNDFCLVSWPTHMVFDGEGVLRQIFTGGDENQQTEAYDKIRPTIEKYLSGN